jgi:XTP/dITP diphosphohydrolase
MMDILLATRNAHKVAEIRGMLGATVRLLSQIELPGAPAVAEEADTFAGNASLKAEGLAAWLEANPQAAVLSETFYVLADDSGLEVDALGGAPGVHSARFASEDARGTDNSSDAANNAKLLRLLADVPMEGRTARFRCVLALAARRQATLFFEGRCEGRVAFTPSGAGGFGYDPLFIPEGMAQSFAELGGEIKNKISHRARALAELRRFLGAAARE